MECIQPLQTMECLRGIHTGKIEGFSWTICPIGWMDNDYECEEFSTKFDPNANIEVETEKFADILEKQISDRKETVDFNTFAKEHQIEYVDFMKLDVEGAELDVLKGSVDFLRGGSVLGAAIEVTFLDIAKQPVFSDVDSFMRKMGFKLFDIEVYRFSRELLPTPEELEYIGPLLIGAPSERGQVIAADALYLRDGAAEIETCDTEFNWTDDSILKLASIFEVYGLPDCAIELLQVARKKNYLGDLDIDYLTDLLTPEFMGKDVTYHEYMENLEHLKELKAKGYQKELSLMGTVWKDTKLIMGILWNDFKLIGDHYLPVPIKTFIRKIILRDYEEKA